MCQDIINKLKMIPLKEGECQEIIKIALENLEKIYEEIDPKIVDQFKKVRAILEMMIVLREANEKLKKGTTDHVP